jgi:hypothetical protein
MPPHKSQGDHPRECGALQGGKNAKKDEKSKKVKSGRRELQKLLALANPNAVGSEPQMRGKSL